MQLNVEVVIDILVGCQGKFCLPIALQRYSKTLKLHENLPIYRLSLFILSVWLLVFLLFTCIINFIIAIVIVILAISIPTEQCLPI